MTWIEIAAAVLAFVAVVGGAWAHGLSRGRSQAVEHAAPPTTPTNTASEHANGHDDDEVAATVETAEHYGIAPGIIVDGLEWLDADDL